MKQHYTDNDIGNLLTSVSRDVFSVREEHFKKILSSIDLDSSLERPVPQKSNTFRSPYMFIQTNMYKFAGAMAVFVVALFGATSYNGKNSATLTNIPSAQIESANTGEVAQTNVGSVSNTITLSQTQDTPSITSAKSFARVATSPETHAINTSVQALQTAEESAADDLLALNEF